MFNKLWDRLTGRNTLILIANLRLAREKLATKDVVILGQRAELARANDDIVRLRATLKRATLAHQKTLADLSEMRIRANGGNQ